MEFLVQETSQSSQSTESAQQLTRKVKALEKDLHYYKKTSRHLRKKLQQQQQCVHDDDGGRGCDSGVIGRRGMETSKELSGSAPQLMEERHDGVDGERKRRGGGVREEDRKTECIGSVSSGCGPVSQLVEEGRTRDVVGLPTAVMVTAAERSKQHVLVKKCRSELRLLR